MAVLDDIRIHASELKIELEHIKQVIDALRSTQKTKKDTRKHVKEVIKSGKH